MIPKISVRAKQIMGQLDNRFDDLSRVELQYYKTILGSELDRHEKEMFVYPVRLQETIQSDIVDVLNRYIDVINQGLKTKIPKDVSNFSLKRLTKRLKRI